MTTKFFRKKMPLDENIIMLNHSTSWPEYTNRLLVKEWKVFLTTFSQSFLMHLFELTAFLVLGQFSTRNNQTQCQSHVDQLLHMRAMQVGLSRVEN